MAYEQVNNKMIARLIGADMNVTSDQQMVMLAKGKFIIRRAVATNPSTDISLGSAAGGIYTAVAKGGSVIVGAGQLYTSLSAASRFSDLTLASGVTNDTISPTQLFFSLTVANGSAATADIYIFGEVLT